MFDPPQLYSFLLLLSVFLSVICLLATLAYVAGEFESLFHRSGSLCHHDLSSAHSAILIYPAGWWWLLSCPRSLPNKAIWCPNLWIQPSLAHIHPSDSSVIFSNYQFYFTLAAHSGVEATLWGKSQMENEANSPLLSTVPLIYPVSFPYTLYGK